MILLLVHVSRLLLQCSARTSYDLYRAYQLYRRLIVSTSCFCPILALHWKMHCERVQRCVAVVQLHIASPYLLAIISKLPTANVIVNVRLYDTTAYLL